MTTKTQIELSLDLAFDLGKQYWMQADSESMKQWKKAEETLIRFKRLKADTLALLVFGKKE